MHHPFENILNTMAKKSSSSVTTEYPVNHNGISTYYADLVFGPTAQSNYLSAEVCLAIQEAASHGKSISPATADEVAAGMQA